MIVEDPQRSRSEDIGPLIDPLEGSTQLVLEASEQRASVLVDGIELSMEGDQDAHGRGYPLRARDIADRVFRYAAWLPPGRSPQQIGSSAVGARTQRVLHPVSRHADRRRHSMPVVVMNHPSVLVAEKVSQDIRSHTRG